MMRHCATCRQQRPLREFDLGGGQVSTTCVGCSNERLRTEDHRARALRNAQITALETRRREMIAALVKIDAEIADLRARPTPTRIVLDDGGEVDAFDDDDFVGGDPAPAREEMS